MDGWASLPSYYLASIGDIIAMPPLGAIHELGIQFELLKFEDAMKKFGISYESFSSGQYKSCNVPINAGSDKISKGNHTNIFGKCNELKFKPIFKMLVRMTLIVPFMMVELSQQMMLKAFGLVDTMLLLERYEKVDSR